MQTEATMRVYNLLNNLSDEDIIEAKEEGELELFCNLLTLDFHFAYKQIEYEC